MAITVTPFPVVLTAPKLASDLDPRAGSRLRMDLPRPYPAPVPIGDEKPTRKQIAAELSRRQLLTRAGGLGLGALVASALPIAERLIRPATAAALDADLDGTMQAFFDTILPGKAVPGLLTQLGNPIHPGAIAGVDPEHGAVYADALALAHNPKIGFDALEPAFLADLQARTTTVAPASLFLDLDYERREQVCIAGLDFANPTRIVWEAAAAVPFTAFCAAANVKNATAKTAAGYKVMGHPGTAPRGYRDFSYGRALNEGITKRGSLP
jgi:hypothetical protein